MTIKRGVLRNFPRWQKEYTNYQRLPSYMRSFKTRLAAQRYGESFTKGFVITSMPRTKKHRIYQLWIYP